MEHRGDKTKEAWTEYNILKALRRYNEPLQEDGSAVTITPMQKKRHKET